MLVLWSENYFQQPKIGSAAFLCGAASVLALGMLAAAAKVTRRPVEQVAPPLAAGVVAFFTWAGAGSGARAAVAFACVVSICVLSYRVASLRPFKALAFVVVCALTLEPGVGVAVQVAHDRHLSIADEHALSVDPTPASRPDVYYIVLDAHARGDVLRDAYGIDSTDWTSFLDRHGFMVPPNSVANYSMTYASIPSGLNMAYVLAPGEIPTKQKYLALQRASSGDNALMSIVKRWGYQYVHIEGGTTETRCGPAVDECLDAPLLDELAWTMLEHSALRRWLIRRYGAHTTQASLSALSHLETLARERADRPRFIFAHVLLPHPPLQLRADCSIVGDERLAGTLMRDASMDLEDVDARKQAYGEQVECLRARLRRMIETLPRDAVVVLQGDHGPDSHGQVVIPPSRWTPEARRERLAIFVAIRAPGVARHLPAVVSPVNIFRAILAGTFRAPVRMLPTRAYSVGPRAGEATARTTLVPLDDTTPADALTPVSRP